MTSGLRDFHDDLRAVARDLLAATSPLVSGGDPVEADWAQLAAAGWLGLEVPEPLGGAAASFAEAAVVLEELGRAATASPYLGGVVLAVGALGLVEPTECRDELLAGIATGEVRASVTGTGFRVERGRLTGSASFVPDAPGADRMLVLAEGAVLVEVAADRLEVVPTPVVDATRSFGSATARDVAVDEARCWPVVGDTALLDARGALAVAIDSLGVGEAALAATVDYASVREQFGRPIGSFQAVKHQCADTRVELALSRRLVDRAVEQLVAGDPGAAVAVSMAKAHATEAAVTAAGRAVQLHGGIGYTWEHGLHAYLKRATLNRSLFGSPAAHRARVARRYVRM